MQFTLFIVIYNIFFKIRILYLITNVTFIIEPLCHDFHILCLFTSFELELEKKIGWY